MAHPAKTESPSVQQPHGLPSLLFKQPGRNIPEGQRQHCGDGDTLSTAVCIRQPSQKESSLKAEDKSVWNHQIIKIKFEQMQVMGKTSRLGLDQVLILVQTVIGTSTRGAPVWPCPCVLETRLSHTGPRTVAPGLTPVWMQPLMPCQGQMNLLIIRKPAWAAPVHVITWPSAPESIVSEPDLELRRALSSNLIWGQQSTTTPRLWNLTLFRINVIVSWVMTQSQFVRGIQNAAVSILRR